MGGSNAAPWSGILLAGVLAGGAWVVSGDAEAGTSAEGSVSRAGDFVYVAGVLGSPRGSMEPAEGIEAQVRQALDNVREALRGEGMDLSHVVRSNVYLSDSRNFQAMNEVYRTYFPNDPPTRATVEADLPVPGALVQVTMIAARPGVSRRRRMHSTG